MIESSSNSFVFIAFCGFLLFNLVVGIYHGRDIKNIEEYALGGRNFTTPLLVSTITATIIGGGSLFTSTEQIYKTGLLYAIAWTGVPLYLIIVAYVFVPRMGEFLGTLSVADAIGKVYGKNIRIISAISAMLACVCIVALQFKVLSAMLLYIFQMKNNEALIIAALVTITYSAIGGLKSVAFTDFIQFFTFLVVLPLIAIVLWGEYTAEPALLSRPLDPMFDIKNFIGFESPKLWKVLPLFILFAKPALSPYMFQRISAGRNVFQVRRAFTISAFIFLFIVIIITAITFFAHSLMPGVGDTGQKYAVIYYIMEHYTTKYTLAALVIGAAAMTMSTADSCLNSGSVMLSHDVASQLKKGIFKNLGIAPTRVISVILGGLAVCFALNTENLLDMLLWSIKIEVVSMPLMIAVLGFRSTPLSVLVSMAAGAITVILMELEIVKLNTNIDSAVFAALASAIGLFGTHYLLGQKGGWVGIKDQTALYAIRAARRRNWQEMIDSIKNFNLIAFFKKNSPESELAYTGFGIFALISLVATSYSISLNTALDSIILTAYPILLMVTFSFVSYPIWPHSIKKEIIPQAIWNFAIFLILVVFSTVALLYSGFSHLQSMIFTANLIVTLILVRTRFSLVMILCGVLFGAWIFEQLYPSTIKIPMQLSTLVYLCLFIGSTFVIFLQPAFRSEEMSKLLNKALNDHINKQSLSMLRLASYKQEFGERLEEYCIRKFKTLENRIGIISSKIAKNENIDHAEVNEIAISLVDGSKYLIGILNQMDEFMAIKTSLKSPEELVDIVISQSKKLHSKVDFPTKISKLKREIECDHGIISGVMKDIIAEGLSRCKDKQELPPVTISVSPTKIKYDLDFTDMFKEITEGVDIKISLPSGISYSDHEVESIRQGKYPNTQFVEWMKAVYAHYGSLKITPDSSSVTFLITIPLTLSKIRPKKMDLLDAPSKIFTVVHSKVIQENKRLKDEISKNMADAGIDKKVIESVMNGAY